MLWTSLATGKRPIKHGVLGHFEISPDGLDIRPVTSYSLKTKTLWSILSQNSLRTHCVNWYASSPAGAINGVCVTNEFFTPAAKTKSKGDSAARAPGPTIFPCGLEDEPRSLLISADEMDDSVLLEMLPKGAAVDLRASPLLQYCRQVMARTASVHAVACRLAENHPWDFMAVLYTGLEQLSHAFMPYHPPRQAHISDLDFYLYQHVVTVAYTLHDMMLGRLVELAGDEAAVILVSDHGFQTGTRRVHKRGAQSLDEAAAAHSSHGILVMRGPDVVRDDTIEGAAIVDIAPTILSVLGIANAADMDGRPLFGAFSRRFEPTIIPSWDRVNGREWEPQPEPAVQTSDELRYLTELGYTEQPSQEARVRITETRRHNSYNLARSFIDARQSEQAIRLLEAIVRQTPDWAEANKTLFETYIALNRTAEARRIVQGFWNRGEQGPVVRLGFALVDLAERKPQAALEHLNEALASRLTLPNLQLLIGQACLRLRDWDAAERAFCAELSINDTCEEAWEGRSAAALGRGQFEAAAEHALHAVGLRADFPRAHYHLGVALVHLERPARAAMAFRRCLNLDPDFLAASKRLVKLYEGPLANRELANRFRIEAEDSLMRRRLHRSALIAPIQPLGAASTTSSGPAAPVPANWSGESQASRQR